MSAPTKTRRIRLTKNDIKAISPKKKNISWREAAKKDIAKHSEGGQMLRGSRHKGDITQKELADSLGISQHHISEMENGKRPIGKEMAKRLAEFFKTDYRIFL
ncbi:MAG: helix-turn-helix transcriptional regulator [Chlamydiota bacterium]